LRSTVTGGEDRYRHVAALGLVVGLSVVVAKFCRLLRFISVRRDRVSLPRLAAPSSNRTCDSRIRLSLKTLVRLTHLNRQGLEPKSPEVFVIRSFPADERPARCAGSGVLNRRWPTCELIHERRLAIAELEVFLSLSAVVRLPKRDHTWGTVQIELEPCSRGVIFRSLRNTGRNNSGRRATS